ncbi:MAG: hypothetical protein ABIN36_09285 [Ferruginibacter sp.]
MNNFKFTGANIAAAVLILAYFFPWVSGLGQSMNGFSIASNGVSPGMLAHFISGVSRLFMILTILVPVCAGIILYQNVTGNKKFEQFYKLSHIVPAAYLIGAIVFLYFKMKPDTSATEDGMFGPMRRTISDMSPGVFDIMSFGIYLSILAAIYLALVSMGKIKDKEYYKPTTATVENKDGSGPQ